MFLCHIQVDKQNHKDYYSIQSYVLTWREMSHFKIEPYKIKLKVASHSLIDFWGLFYKTFMVVIYGFSQ